MLLFHTFFHSFYFCSSDPVSLDSVLPVSYTHLFQRSENLPLVYPEQWWSRQLIFSSQLPTFFMHDSGNDISSDRVTQHHKVIHETVEQNRKPDCSGSFFQDLKRTSCTYKPQHFCRHEGHHIRKCNLAPVCIRKQMHRTKCQIRHQISEDVYKRQFPHRDLSQSCKTA